MRFAHILYLDVVIFELELQECALRTSFARNRCDCAAGRKNFAHHCCTKKLS